LLHNSSINKFNAPEQTMSKTPKFASFKAGTTAEDVLDLIDGQVIAYMAGKRGVDEYEMRKLINMTEKDTTGASYQRKVIRARDQFIKQFGAPAAKLFNLTSKAGK
jgi:hypothetical protein